MLTLIQNLISKDDMFSIVEIHLVNGDIIVPISVDIYKGDEYLIEFIDFENNSYFVREKDILFSKGIRK